MLFLCAWLAAAPSTAAVKLTSVVTATDTRGLALRNVQVLVDGLALCATTPCSMELEPGAHQIDVIDRTTDQRAGRSLSVGKGERAVIHFALPVDAVRRAAPTTAAAPPPPDGPISVDELAREESSSQAPIAGPASPPASPRGAGERKSVVVHFEKGRGRAE